MTHWTDRFDWDNAKYWIINLSRSDDDAETPEDEYLRKGPIIGKEAALKAARDWHESDYGCLIEIKEVSHNCPVAAIMHGGELTFHTVKDDTGTLVVPWL